MRQQCQGPQDPQPLRALVILRGGLTTDSPRRTIPELKRAAEVDCDTPTTLTITPARGGPAMASPFYHIRAGAPIDSPHDRAR